MAHHPYGQESSERRDNSTYFDTPIGRCVIAWTGRGVSRLRLPDTDCSVVTAHDPPRVVQQAIERITALLRGESADLSGIPIDLEGVPPFHQRVYEIARRIPAGTTTTYGEIAAALGTSGASRAVGQALGRNPVPIIVPCHRVLAAGGKSGGFSAPGGVTTKMRLLEIEGLPMVRGLLLFERSEAETS